MLKGKKILIVGASRGIGEAIAISYAKEGADLVITGRNIKTLQPVLDKLKAIGANAYALEWDVSDVAKGPDVMKQAASLMGGLNVVVNNAGVIDREPFLNVT